MSGKAEDPRNSQHSLNGRDEDVSIPQNSIQRLRKVHKKRKVIPSLEIIEPIPCYMNRIPLELLAEILLYMPSTKSILAMARCSKYFCATLVNNESSVFIWKRVRASSNPQPIPDPTPNFTEPAYAAFIFDGGQCEVCDKTTKYTYMSFALRVRLCGSPECNRQLSKKITSAHHDKPFAKWLPSVESNACFSSSHISPNPTQWPNCQKRFRSSEIQSALAEWLVETDRGTVHAYEERHRIEIKTLPLKMQLAVNLSVWKRVYQGCRLDIKRKNEEKAEVIAKKEGWTTWDLIHSETYGSMHRNHTDNLEEVQLLDFELIRPEVEAEITKIVESRKRRADEEAYRRHRDDIQKHYDQLKSSGKEKILPSLPQFRQLPFVHILQSRTSTTTGATSDPQRSQLVAELIRSDLKKWRESTMATLGATLGFPKWKSASKIKLHPVDRLTARFKCTKCDKESYKFYPEGCLNFSAACEHVCPRLDWNKKTREHWTADQFVKDEKAIAAVSQLLTLCDGNAEARESFDAVKNLGTRIKCQSCNVTMDFTNMIGHSHRHDNMTISLLSIGEAVLISASSLPFGSCSKLLGSSAPATKLRSLKQFGCRHCEQSLPGLSTGTTSLDTEVPSTGGNGPRQESGPTKKLFTFNGLRSHAKNKHSIEQLRDEDAFCKGNLDGLKVD